MDAQFLAGAGVTIIGALVWLIRLEGKVNMNSKSVTDIKEDIHYIRTRVDAAINGRRD